MKTKSNNHDVISSFVSKKILPKIWKEGLVMEELLGFGVDDDEDLEAEKETVKIVGADLAVEYE